MTRYKRGSGTTLNEYRFSRALTRDERLLLMELINQRRWSDFITDNSGAVVGCLAHRDELAAFLSELRKLADIARLKRYLRETERRR